MSDFPSDPSRALAEAASYLRTVRIDRPVREHGELVGYWQTPEWIEGLLQIADELDRISKLPKMTEQMSSVPRQTPVGTHVQRAMDAAVAEERAKHVREKFAAMNFADGFSDFHFSATDEQLLTQARLCCRGADALIAALNEDSK